MKAHLKEVFYTAAKLANQFGILDQTAYRNNCMRIEFEELKISNKGETVEQILEILAAKNYLSISRVKEICYPPDSENTKEIIKDVAQPIAVRRKYARRRSD